MVEYIAHTKRSKMTKPRAVKIFLARNGMCCLCHTQISTSERWFIEHPHSLALGGSDDDAELWPAHYSCKSLKDAQDAAEKAARDKVVASGWMKADRPAKAKGRPIPGSRASGLRKRMNGQVERR